MPIAENKSVSYGELKRWDDTERWELYDGEPVALAAASLTHQDISLGLASQMRRLLRSSGCRVYQDVDARLFQTPDADENAAATVVRPDVAVICDPAQRTGHSISGAPDVAVEILSRSTRSNDQIRKLELYEKAGVAEYWIVDPAKKTVSVFTLRNERYHAPDVYQMGDTVPFPVAGDSAQIDLGEVFEGT